jgi:NADH-quinone oxidoreductase subunit M
VIAIIYTSLVALVQEDIKKLIAYSSVAHMGFVTMGIFALNKQGIQGAMFQMISHGIVSGALFLCVGVVYDRMHTREIAAYGGLVNRMPPTPRSSWSSPWPMSACRARPALSVSS